MFAFASKRLGAHTRLAQTTSLACRVKGWVLDEKRNDLARELRLSMIQFGLQSKLLREIRFQMPNMHTWGNPRRTFDDVQFRHARFFLAQEK